MTRLESILEGFPDLQRIELFAWIERRWVQPEPAEEGEWVFHEIDVARVHLIYDLRRALGIAEETVPLVLALLDQVYELRRTLKSMTRALESQPPEIRRLLLAALEQAKSEGER
jgi:chaperone modulatory protein CbpM